MVTDSNLSIQMNDLQIQACLRIQDIIRFVSIKRNLETILVFHQVIVSLKTRTCSLVLQ